MTWYGDDLFGLPAYVQMMKLLLPWFFFPVASLGLFVWAGSLNYAIFLFNKGWEGIQFCRSRKFNIFLNPFAVTPDLKSLPPHYGRNGEIRFFSYAVWISFIAVYVGFIIAIMLYIYAVWKLPDRPINLYHIKAYVLDFERVMKWFAIIPTVINSIQFLILIPKGYFRNAYSVYRENGPCRWRE